MTAPDLKELGLVDELIPEPSGGAHKNWDTTIASVKESILIHHNDLKRLKGPTLIKRRQERFRDFGSFTE